MYRQFLTSAILFLVLHHFHTYLIVSASPALTRSDRKLPDSSQLENLLRCYTHCTEDRSEINSCRRRGCRVHRCELDGHPAWKCLPRKETPACKPSSKIARRKIHAGCKGCKDRTIVAFGYSWLDAPICLKMCMVEELGDVCKMTGFSQEHIAEAYENCCVSCKGTSLNNRCDCYGSIDEDGLCNDDHE